MWRIQTTGLASRYGVDEEFNLSLRNLSALAFIFSEEIPQAFDILKQYLPREASDVTEWFENNYVHGRVRRHMRNGTVLRSPPLFPPTLWSVYDSIQSEIPRTQNIAWHRRCVCVIGRTCWHLYDN